MEAPLLPEHAAALRAAADDSSYSVSEWVAAVAVLEAHLKATGKSADFSAKLGYVSCCAELGARDPLRPALKNVTEDMLELHGFAGG